MSMILITMQLFIGCASFSKESFKDEMMYLSENNFTNINGSYKTYPSKVYEEDMKKIISSKMLTKTNTYKLFNLNHKVNSLDSLSLNNNIDRIEIIFANSKEFEVKYFIGKTMNSNIKMSGELKNGFFYLDDKISNSWGIPLLFGGYNSHKRRIGLSKKGNLIFNSVYDKGGGMLFIFSNGSSYNISYEIEKLKL